MKKIILALLITFSNGYGHLLHYHADLSIPIDPMPQPTLLLNTGEHQLLAKSSDGLIEFEDGTQFKVIPSDCYVLNNWNFYDLLTFTPNTSYFRQSEFYILNETTGGYVRANIWASPALKNPQALCLSHINPQKEEVILSMQDGMNVRWKIDSKDFKNIHYWQIGDMIVIGKNPGLFCFSCSHNAYILVSYAATKHVLYLRGTPQPL